MKPCLQLVFLVFLICHTEAEFFTSIGMERTNANVRMQLLRLPKLLILAVEFHDFPHMALSNTRLIRDSNFNILNTILLARS